MKKAVRRVLVLASLPSSLVNFRGALLQALIDRGHEVHAVAPGLISDESTITWLRSTGVICHDVELSRAGLNPISDLRALAALFLLMFRTKPDVVLGYTIKPVIWGTVAAKLAGVPTRIALITGVGYAFTGPASGKRRVVQHFAQRLYRLALRQAHKVIFQNPDDANLFLDLGLVRREQPVALVNGSGVDTKFFPLTPIPKQPLSFLLIARLLGDKGIREYAAAADIVRKLHPSIEFHLVGGHDQNPDGIPPEEVASWQAANILIWHGELSDIRPAIAASHVYVLPSYREGTPRTVLEAMAMGRAIITTDAPGCRETVVDRDNGLLVDVASVEQLAEAMLEFISNPQLASQMGARSRQVAVDKFDVHKVNAVMLKEMGL
jgi:glycosyltransferase involved in cell wall biosynthesis